MKYNHHHHHHNNNNNNNNNNINNNNNLEQAVAVSTGPLAVDVGEGGGGMRRRLD